jgi:dihydroorotate dehydrogenase
MFSKLRSLIFKFDPEVAHNLAIKSLKLNLTPNLFDENKDIPMFQSNLFGKKIDNPIGIAAGFDKNAEVYNSLFNLGFGFVEVGTVTPLEQYGNPKPRVFRLVKDQALINRLGFNNLGAENVSNRIRSNLSKGLLGINIGPNKDSKDRLNDYLIGLRNFYDIANYITINISSPNTENLRNFHDETKFDELINSINEEKDKLKSKIPIVVKISPDISEKQVETISEILLKHNVSAVIVSNTTAINRQNLQDIIKHQKGGLSGKPLEMISNKLISKFYRLLKNKIQIIGVGGVDSGESAYKKFLAGASFIQLYTGMVFQGPSIVIKIKKELKEILINQDVKNFREIIGKNHTN